MDRLFRIDFYPQDWIIDTGRLTLEERGLYIQIVSLIYANRGAIENDAAWIAGVSGCSVRKAKSIISQLEARGVIQISGSKITQKRAENELKSKREHLEVSSKGGRKSAETRAKDKEINDVASTDDTKSVGTSTPTPPPNPKEEDKPHTPLGVSHETDRGGAGVLKSGDGKVEFRLEPFIDGEAIMEARLNAPGWDIYHLMRVYDEGVNDGSRPRPQHPAKAFPAWCKLYTKGKPPS